MSLNNVNCQTWILLIIRLDAAHIGRLLEQQSLHESTQTALELCRHLVDNIHTDTHLTKSIVQNVRLRFYETE